MSEVGFNRTRKVAPDLRHEMFRDSIGEEFACEVVGFHANAAEVALIGIGR